MVHSIFIDFFSSPSGLSISCESGNGEEKFIVREKKHIRPPIVGRSLKRRVMQNLICMDYKFNIFDNFP